MKKYTYLIVCNVTSGINVFYNIREVLNKHLNANFMCEVSTFKEIKDINTLRSIAKGIKEKITIDKIGSSMDDKIYSNTINFKLNIPEIEEFDNCIIIHKELLRTEEVSETHGQDEIIIDFGL